MVIRYRGLQRNDIEQVQSVALRSWKHTYRNIYSPQTITRFVSTYYSTDSFERFVFPRMKRGLDWFYVVVDGKKIVGYSHLGRRSNGWQLLRVYLLAEYQGKGIGKKLLGLGEAFLIRQKAKLYFLYVHAKNKPAQEFYLRNGFVRIKRRDRGTTSLYFEKILTR